LESQVHILMSESIVVPVIRSMDLIHDTELVGPPDALAEVILWNFSRFASAAKQAIFHADVTRIDPNIALERTAVETFLKALTVAREDVANVITVTFASRDPTKAANIANAVADNYIATTLEAKVNSTKIATEWLQDRLMQLKTQTLDAERELQN